jgi:hypothetical protein
MKKLILELKNVLEKQQSCFKEFSLDERLNAKAVFLRDLQNTRFKLESELISASQNSPITSDNLSLLSPQVQKRLVNNGLKVSSLKFEVQNLTDEDFEVLLNEFFKRTNMEVLLSDLIHSTVSYSLVPKTLKSKKKGDRTELVIDTNYSVNTSIVKKYVRQNFRELGMILFPKKYDRNKFNELYAFIIEKSNRISAVFLALKQIMNDIKQKLNNNRKITQLKEYSVHGIISELNLIQVNRPIIQEVLFR